MIEIWEPRWHDRTVLIAEFKCPRTGDFEIKILKSKAVEGTYIVKEEVFKNAKRELMKTKKGVMMKMVVVPLDELIKKEEENAE